jgi:hypothetical protein
MKTYTLDACEKLIKKYDTLGGEILTVREGVLGLGTVVCCAEGYKTAIINEVYLNSWSSGHTVRFYNKMPEKYSELLDKVLC